MQMNRPLITIALGLVATCAFGNVPSFERTEGANEVDTWGTAYPVMLTPDGGWFVYLLTRAPLDGESGVEKVTVVVRSTRNDVERRYSAIGDLKMATSGRWIGFHAAPSESMQASNETTVVLVEVHSGQKVAIPGIQEFSFIGEMDEKVLLHHYPIAAGASTYDVTVRSLNDGRTKTFSSVMRFVANRSATSLAFTNEQGLQIYDFRSQRTQLLDSEAGSIYQQLTWSDRGTALAMLQSNPERMGRLAIFTRVDSDKPKKVTFAPEEWANFPKSYEFPADGELIWREDENGLFFQVQAALSPTAGRQTAPNLVLWHSQDWQLPEWKKNHANQRPMDWAFVSLEDGRYMQLTDASVAHVQPHRRGRYVLGFASKAFDWWSNSRTVRPRDYFLVDLQTGQRTPVVGELQTITISGSVLSIEPRLSPSGSHVLYQDNDGDYIAYDVASGQRQNLTATLPTKFYYKENDPRGRRIVRENATCSEPLVGWSDDNADVLISDFYDVWALPLNGSRPTNLTENGRRDVIAYCFLFPGAAGALETGSTRGFGGVRTAPGEDYLIDLNQPMYFSVQDYATARFGFARYNPNARKTEMLYLNEAEFSHLKAHQADVYVNLVSTGKLPADYYLLDARWSATKRLTDNNPQERLRPRWAGVKQLSYAAANGDALTAKLYLPAGYEKGRRYPTIVSVYEEAHGRPSYYYPQPDDSETGRWMKKGYAVLLPAIRPRLGEPGAAAIDAVTAAIDAAVATGVVDRDRLGLRGYSYGAYETFLLISQTNIFKAAAPKAGVTDLLSAYGGVYGAGVPLAGVVESGGAYMRGPWWEQWQAYLENSPLFYARDINTPLLIVHGDLDEAVPFAQSVEMFNTLRRMGNKRVVLLQYVGADHTFPDGAQRQDIQARTEEFFDHFLLDAPAPNWWSEGISYPEGRVPAIEH